MEGRFLLHLVLLAALPRLCESSRDSGREAGGDSADEAVVEIKGHGNAIKKHQANTSISEWDPDSNSSQVEQALSDLHVTKDTSAVPGGRVAPALFAAAGVKLQADPSSHADPQVATDEQQEPFLPEFGWSPHLPPLSLGQGHDSVIMDSFVKLSDDPPESTAAIQSGMTDGMRAWGMAFQSVLAWPSASILWSIRQLSPLGHKGICGVSLLLLCGLIMMASEHHRAQGRRTRKDKFSPELVLKPHTFDCNGTPSKDTWPLTD